VYVFFFRGKHHIAAAAVSLNFQMHPRQPLGSI
jgi:hypothetical protein